MPFIPDEEGAAIVPEVVTDEMRNLTAEGLDPTYTGMPPSTAAKYPWWLIAAVAIGLYLVWGDD